MRILIISLTLAGGAALLVSVLLGWLKRSDQADAWRGLAFLLFLAMTGLRGYQYFNPPTAEQVFEERYGPRTAGPLFGSRYVKADARGVLFDLVVKPRSENGSWMLHGAAQDAITLGKWMSRHPDRAPSGDVALTLRINLIDKYGAVSEREVLTLRWANEDWRKVQWETVTPSLIVGLAELPMAWPAVHDNVRAWCNEPENQRWMACGRFSAS
jgi:hypothetical protein